MTAFAVEKAKEKQSWDVHVVVHVVNFSVFLLLFFFGALLLFLILVKGLAHDNL